MYTCSSSEYRKPSSSRSSAILIKVGNKVFHLTTTRLTIRELSQVFNEKSPFTARRPASLYFHILSKSSVYAILDSMAYKTSNPALNKNSFKGLPSTNLAGSMTLSGTAFKSIMLLMLCICGGVIGWRYATESTISAAQYLLLFSILASIVAVLTILYKKISPVTAPVYALLEGIVIGALSRLLETQFEGIVLQSALLTVSIFLAMLLLYLSRIIKPTENFKLGVAAATGGIAMYYLMGIILNLLGIELPLINSNSAWGIGFSVLVIVVASFNLVVDFDFVEKGVTKRAPKYMEWYAGFGLLVTMVWLYLEILRILTKIRSR